jgi:two-component system chemotaxis response regulator CheB
MNAQPSSANPIRVLVVDDSTFMRGALVRMIERNPQFKVIDVASNGQEGVEKAQALKPDVITMDIEMPVMTGIEALAKIMQTTKTPVVMISTLTEHGAEATLKAMELGAVDFIPKALADKDKNIFKNAEDIHQKLLAAAGAKPQKLIEESTTPAELPASKPAVTPQQLAARMVVIGSSTGGPKALQVLLQALPKNLPVPVLVAQHMPADFTRVLARRLDEICGISVTEAKAGDTPRPGTVYIAPGGLHLRLEANGCTLHPDNGESPYMPSIDVLGDSVQKVLGAHVIAVLLTGMGADGAKAFTALKNAGAYTIGQDAASCVVYGMPRALAEADGASEVLPLEQIGPRIRQLLGV